MQAYTTSVSVRDGGHYVPAMRNGNTVYFSGHLSIDPETGKPAEGGVRAEAAMALNNLKRSMDAAGVRKEDIIQCRVYLPDVAYWSDLNIEYARFFGSHKPVRTVVPTGPLYGGCKAEIEAVACIPEEKEKAQ